MTKTGSGSACKLSGCVCHRSTEQGNSTSRRVSGSRAAALVCAGGSRSRAVQVAAGISGTGCSWSRPPGWAWGARWLRVMLWCLFHSFVRGLLGLGASGTAAAVGAGRMFWSFSLITPPATSKLLKHGLLIMALFLCTRVLFAALGWGRWILRDRFLLGWNLRQEQLIRRAPRGSCQWLQKGNGFANWQNSKCFLHSSSLSFLFFFPSPGLQQVSSTLQEVGSYTCVGWNPRAVLPCCGILSQHCFFTPS